MCYDEENYPGEHRDIERQQIIEKAAEAADRIIMDGSDGSVEETDYLTAKVADRLLGHLMTRVSSNLLRRDFEKRTKSNG